MGLCGVLGWVLLSRVEGREGWREEAMRAFCGAVRRRDSEGAPPSRASRRVEELNEELVGREDSHCARKGAKHAGT